MFKCKKLGKTSNTKFLERKETLVSLYSRPFALATHKYIIMRRENWSWMEVEKKIILMKGVALEKCRI